MAILLLLALIAAATAVVCWIALHDRVRNLEDEVARLKLRIADIEEGSRKVAPKPPGHAPAANDAAIQPSAAKNIEPNRPVENIAPRPEFLPLVEHSPIDVPTPPDRLRNFLGEEGWEVLVGGSLLNKIGALVLVIGLALFLAYSFTYMSPAGRAMTCVITSWTLLGLGVLLERKPAYKIFARGLIGAGWAALYVTAYAIYAVPAARLIENPLIASVLLLVVTVGMIGHSLAYRRQALTAVAYFAAFAALTLMPWSTFGLFGLLPLAASLLWIVLRMNWYGMALFGVISLYGSYTSRGTSNATLIGSESLLLVCWLLFEGFDILRASRRKTGHGIEYVFPVNAVAFLTLSYNAWLIKNPGRLWIAFAFGALLFLSSAIVRCLVGLRERSFNGLDLPAHMRAGSFELPVAFAAVLAAVSMKFRLVGLWVTAGLAIEAEIIYLSGVALNSPILRGLAGAGFAASLLRMFVNDISSQETLPGIFSRIHAWSLVALLNASAFYLNRALRKTNVIMSSIAAGLIAGVLFQEVHQPFIGTAWLALGLLLFEIGLRCAAKEFRFQAYMLALGGVALNVAFYFANSWDHPWLPSALALCPVYCFLFRSRDYKALDGTERSWFENTASGAITCFAMLCSWQVAPQNYRALAVLAVSLLLLELGNAGIPRGLRYFSRVAAAVAAIAAVWTKASGFNHQPAAQHVWITYAVATVLLYAFSERTRGDSAVRGVSSSISVAFALCTLKLLLPDRFVPLSWAVTALVLFLSGRWRSLLWERWASYVVVICSFVAAVAVKLPWASIGIPIAGYTAEFLSDDSPQVERHARSFWSIAASVALTSLLWEKFPGGMLTTAWGLEGIALLAAGFVLSERVLRLEGLVVLLTCVLKVFLYDLRNLETGYRILSFIGLGLILLIVSSIYARFRNQIRKRL